MAMIDLTKGAEMKTSAGTALTKLHVGVGWDVSGGGKKGLLGRLNKFKGVDLDLSAVAFEGKDAVAACWFDNAKPLGGALEHTGDNRTGRGDDDDETIIAHLDLMPPQVTAVVFTLSSYKGASFENVNNATGNLYDASAGEPQKIGTVFLPIQGNKTAALIAKITRGADGTWSAKQLKDLGHGKTWRDLAQLAKPHIK